VRIGIPGTIQLGDEEDELKVFAGHSQVLSRKPYSSAMSKHSSGPNSEPVTTRAEESSVNSGSPDAPWPDVHPSVLKYLSDDPLANLSQRTTDATLLAWFGDCDPPGVPTSDIFASGSTTIPQVIEEEALDPITLGNPLNLNLGHAPANANEQWQAFLTQFDIIDADTKMDDIMNQHSTYPPQTSGDELH
jgi:hypothetical protein